MQTQFLKRYAPNSLHLLFHPVDTGNPSFDFNVHLEQYANRRADTSTANGRHQPSYTGNITRIDLESTQLIGGRVLGRVEIDLGPVDEAEQQYKILAVPYAEKQLASNEDAVEFVRVIKQAVAAGVEADPRSLQIWASWAYREINNRHGEYVLANRGASFEEIADARAEIIRQVLKEIAFLAMELTEITSTNEDRLLDEPNEVELFFSRDQQLTKQETEDLHELRWELAFNHDTSGPFASELKAICSKISPAHASGIVYNEEAQFQSYLSDMAEAGTNEEGLEALLDSHERVTEQYTEGGVVSLHMSDGERFVVDGTLEDDVTEEYLPQEARIIASDVHQMFVDGEDLEMIDGFIEFSLNRIYGDPSDKASRVSRTMRSVSTRFEPTRMRADGTCSTAKSNQTFTDPEGFHHRPMAATGTRTAMFEYTYRVSVYPNREERQYVREVLDILVEAMQRDFILRSMNRSTTFRMFHNAIAEASDVRSLISTIQDAYQARLKNNISIKMFTALNTLYEIKRARFESTAMKVTKIVDGHTRTFIPAIPVIAMARSIKTRDLRTLATRMHTLPNQERERVCRIFQNERPELYARILNGLLDMIQTASQGKRMYLRFAFYQDRKTGRPNEAHNMVHLLTASDTASLWQALKASSGVAEPIAA